MGLIDRMRAVLARGLVKAMSITLVPEWLRTSFMQPTFRALTDEGYKANGAVFACIEALAFSFPEPPLGVYRETDGGRNALPVHPLATLLHTPNSQMGRGELMQYTITYLAIGGNCYWYKVRSAAKRVVQLLPLNDSQITPIAGGSSLVSHYEFDNGTGKPDIIAASEIVHFKWMPDPLQPWRGLAPLKAVAREVDTDNEATKYLFALLKNDAVPRVALIVPPTTTLDDDKMRRLDKEWRDKYGGDNRGRPAILEGGLDIKTLSLNLQEMAFEALRRVPEARIAAAFRVPPIVAGLNVGLERSTYANFAEAAQQFTLRTLIPLWRMVEEEITADLLPEFGGRPGEVVAFATDGVAALAEIVQKRREMADTNLRSGWMTVNEARAQAGLAKDPQGDIYLRQMSTVEVTLGQARPVAPPVVPAPVTPPAGPEPEKGLGVRSIKSQRDRRAAQQAYIAAQRMARNDLGRRMENEIDAYFAGLAERVLGRALKSHGQRGQVKDLPTAEELLPDAEQQGLVEIVKRFFISLVQASWDYFNGMLGVSVEFDLTDPSITEILATAGTRVREINQTTLDELRRVLQYGNENGWSIDHLVRGDPEAGVRGIKDIVEQTYKGRAKTIARTELGNAQNKAAVSRFGQAGVTHVYVQDNGLDDDDEPCQIVNNTVQTLAWATVNPLEHPNCTRCFSPEFV